MKSAATGSTFAATVFLAIVAARLFSDLGRWEHLLPVVLAAATDECRHLPGQPDQIAPV